MKCPHCSTGVKVELEEYFDGRDPNRENYGYEIHGGDCPECNGLIVLLKGGRLEPVTGAEYPYEVLKDVEQEEFLFPKLIARKVEPEVPNTYRQDFIEAFTVMQFSPKASAALSRRLLQQILREKFSVKHSSLAREIDEFIQRKDVPSYLVEAVDAVRNVGNFAAHPVKDTSTGEIVEVEPGEAEWLLEVLDSLFDFAFVQPRRLAERKEKLNEKLESIGKPPMKG